MADVTRASLLCPHDGFAMGALRASPPNAGLGGVVVIQEIFGLTDHIAEMTGFFADAGYETIAPSLYDRVEQGFLAGHDAEGFAKAREAVMGTPWTQVAADIDAAAAALPQPVFVTGFCWGGTASWVAAQHCAGVRAVSCFYGRLIVDVLAPKPKAPVMLHYGARDPSIPPDQVERVRAAAPDSPLYLYDACHGFCRKGSADYNAEASALALQRTLDWFARWRA